MTWLLSKALCESLHCSPEPVAESLEDTCSDGEPYAQLNVMPTPHKFWRNDKTMDACNLSRFGLTLRLLTESHGEELLTLFLAGFPVRTYPQLEEGQESTESEAGCGLNSLALLARFDPVTHSLKTAQRSLFEDLTESSVILPRWGLMRSGALYQQPAPAHLTYEKEYGLWPTPDASCAHRGWSKTIAEKCLKGDRKRKSGATIGSSLAWEPRLLEDYSPGMRLNPNWLEWLMGWPIAHTELKPLATDKFHEWQQQHSPNLRGKAA